ncbi:hypothetical protein GCM10010124_07670 [Pilimelia terevasa]|uniref:PDZ domain-containing protein n=1 Tax=Pilimelia terevasa TaxID=53372 RepID=A0A8J3BKL5_9ACTN|nr:trypsin-like peptidase domain-containing protein [Pilimelia terevasa]GGK17596.1 hypothetical protein GCM10010124_07670 [Pilimelia terevasa]
MTEHDDVAHGDPQRSEPPRAGTNEPAPPAEPTAASVSAHRPDGQEPAGHPGASSPSHPPHGHPAHPQPAAGAPGHPAAAPDAAPQPTPAWAAAAAYQPAYGPHAHQTPAAPPPGYGPAAAGHGPGGHGYGGAAAHGTGPHDAATHAYATGAHQSPSWLTNTGSHPAVGTEEQSRRRRRGGLIAAIGAGAVFLALCSGVTGALITRGMSDGPLTSLDASTGAPAAVLNRESLAGIADGVTPSVVSISTGRGEGSGVVMSTDGFIVTNNHVVATAPNGQVTVSFRDGKNLPGKVVGTDPRTDLGVVKVEGVSDLKPAKFGNSSAMRVGDTVMAVGSPLGLQGSVTAGIVSYLNRSIRAGGGDEDSPLGQPSQTPTLAGLMQTDAPINPGNSGGALVNLDGEVIGINTAIATAGSQGNIGVGFAIPSNRAKAVAEQIKSGQKVSHPFLGVDLADAEAGGALIGSVAAGSPAAKAGLLKGDIITEFGGRKIGKADDLVSAVQSGKVGDNLSVSYTRNGKAATATVTLGEAT